MGIEYCDHSKDDYIVTWMSGGYKGTCPVCTLIEELKETNALVTKLSKEIDDVTDQNDQLTSDAGFIARTKYEDLPTIINDVDSEWGKEYIRNRLEEGE